MIEEYTINIPPMDVQHKVMEIIQLQQREKQLYERIMDLRNKLIQKQLIEIIKYGE